MGERGRERRASRQEAREHIVKMAELYRNLKPSPWVGEVKGGGKVRSAGRSHRYQV